MNGSASMGPRARARGNAGSLATTVVKINGLQWGHERALVEMAACAGDT